MISNVNYELILLLTKELNYEGKLTVDFKLKEKDIDDLFLDFHGRSVASMYVNDNRVDDSSIIFSKHRVCIPKYYLKSHKINKV